jgi:hypothetical protein
MVLLLAEGLAISISQFIQLAIFQTQTFTRCDSLQVATAAGKEKKKNKFECSSASVTF